MFKEMKSRYLPFLKRRLTTEESVMGCARELIFRIAIYTNADSKAGSLIPSYTAKVTGIVTVEELLKACEGLLKHGGRYEVEPYCTKRGVTEVVNLAMLELLLYQRQNSVKNTVKTVLKLRAALQQLGEQQIK